MIGRDYLGDLNINRKIILKWNLRRNGTCCGPNSHGSGQETVVGYCEDDKDPSDFQIVYCASDREILKNSARTPTVLTTVRITDGSQQILGRATLWHEFTKALGNVESSIHVFVFVQWRFSDVHSTKRSTHVTTACWHIKWAYPLLLWLYYYLTRDGYFILWICTHRLEQIWYMVMEVFIQEAYIHPDTLIL
jgi:hypothetical protein